MKAFFVVAGIALLGTASAFGTNGFDLIGLSPRSVGMGGTGVANLTGSTDGIYKNPALLNELSMEHGPVAADLNATLIKPSATANGGAGELSSSAGSRIAPQLGAAYKFNDKFAVGLGAFAVGGNFIDYKGTALANEALFQLQSEMRVYRFAAAAAYRILPELTIGVSPFLAYDQLNINEDVTTQGTQSSRSMHGGSGFGAEFGLLAKPIENVQIGATFTTRQSVTLPQIINLGLFSSNPAPAIANPTLNDLNLQHPMQIAAGVLYSGLQNWKFTFDWRFINWANSDVFRELGWNNQNVLAVGAEYMWSDWAFRAGFNYAPSVIDNVSNESGATSVSISGQSVELRRVSLLNLTAFPAISQSHITLGTGYRLCKEATFDASFLYSPKVTITRSGQGGATSASESATYSYVGTMSQWAVSAGITAQF